MRNIRSISYCGGWTKCGSHEDGLSSGLAVAINHLGAKLLFDFVDPTTTRREKPTLTIKNYLRKLAILSRPDILGVIGAQWSVISVFLNKVVVARRKVS